MALFKNKKKEENTDEFHKDYGTINNCKFVLGKIRKYRKSLLFYLVAAGIAGASMSYIWGFIGKLVIDMIERQAGSGDVRPLLYLTLGTTVFELAMKWLNTVSTMKLDVGFTYVRLMIVKERIAKTLTMEYENHESPEMLDRLQKAKRATDGDYYHGIQGMMYRIQSMAVQIVSVITAVTIMTTFNPLIIVIIGVLGVIQFLFFDYIRKKDKKEMWDAMAPHWRKMNYMWDVTANFSYAKDIRLFGMKKFLAGKYHDVNQIELEHWVKSRQYWIYNSIFAHGIHIVRQLIIIGWLIYSVIYDGLSIGNFLLYFSSAGAFSGA